MRKDWFARPVNPSLVAAVLVCLSALVSYGTALRLHDLRVFEQPNVWFHADSNLYLLKFTRIPMVDERHPTLSLIVYGAVSSLARALAAIHARAASAREWSIWLALLIAPVAAGTRTLLLFKVFQQATRRLWPAAMLATLDIASLASVATGSIPESFGVSALCTAAMYWLALDEQPRSTRMRFVLWLLLGTAAVGTTITNFIPFTILLAFALHKRGAMIGGALRDVVLTTGAVLMLTGILTLAQPARSANLASLGPPRGEITMAAFHAPNVNALRQLAWAISHTFVAPSPEREQGKAADPDNPEYSFILTFSELYQHGRSSAWRAALTVLLLVLGTLTIVRRGDARLAVAAGGIVASNAAMHVFWGDHYFLYSLHWQSSLLILLSGLALVTVRGRLAGDALLAGFAAVTVVNSWTHVLHLISRLASA